MGMEWVMEKVVIIIIIISTERATE